MYKRLDNNDIVCLETGEVISPKFDKYETPYDYEEANVVALEPMTAKEFLNEEELELMLHSTEYYAEEKLDGTRATMHIREDGNRIFSRRISKKTDWYVENSDSVPHLRDMEVPEEFMGTILDGEMIIDGKEFKDVSSTLNCTWDKAIDRQIELGFITFHAFDIIYYKGIYIAKMPLEKRKMYLKKVVEDIGSPYVTNQLYTFDNVVVTFDKDIIKKFSDGKLKESSFPNLHRTIEANFSPMPFTIEIDKRTWYEYIVFNGGEGIMLKHKEGTYRHTRGREYTKLKKFETWDCVILDYMPPTRDYTGKEANNPEALWNYWYDAEDDSRIVLNSLTMKEAEQEGLLPCTKHYAMDWIGTIKYGIVISDEELEAWKKANPKEKPEIIEVVQPNKGIVKYLVVGEASGFDEETRAFITENKHLLKYRVIELKAQEVLKTGKLRHPRFLRLRDDKSNEQCIWKDHIRK